MGHHRTRHGPKMMDILTDQDMDKYITGPPSVKPTGTTTPEEMDKWERGTRKALLNQSASVLVKVPWLILEGLLRPRRPGTNYNLSTVGAKET